MPDDNLELFLNYIIQHYRVIKEVDLIKLAYRFYISKEEALSIMIKNGWEAEKGLEGYFSPNVKDRHSMLDKTDFKQNQIDDDYIDKVRPND